MDWTGIGGSIVGCAVGVRWGIWTKLVTL